MKSRFSLLLLYVATCSQEVNHNGKTYESTFLTLLCPKCCHVASQCLSGFTDLIGKPVFSPAFTDQKAQMTMLLILNIIIVSSKHLFHVCHCQSVQSPHSSSSGCICWFLGGPKRHIVLWQNQRHIRATKGHILKLQRALETPSRTLWQTSH